MISDKTQLVIAGIALLLYCTISISLIAMLDTVDGAPADPGRVWFSEYDLAQEIGEWPCR